MKSEPNHDTRPLRVRVIGPAGELDRVYVAAAEGALTLMDLVEVLKREGAGLRLHAGYRILIEHAS